MRIHNNSGTFPGSYSGVSQTEPFLPSVVDEIEHDRPQGSDSKSSRCCSTLVLAFVFLAGLAILLFWLIARPRQPIFIVNESSIHGYNLTSSNHLSGAFNFAVRAYNPSSKMSYYYEFIDIVAYHGGEVVSYAGVYPFSQSPKNETYLRFGGVAKDMPLFEPPGEVDLNIELKGNMWYKAGSWTFNRYKMKAECFPVVVYFNSTREFQPTNCYVTFE